MTERKLTVQQDSTGLFVKFRVFKNHWLIVRPGRKDYVFDQGDEVRVSYADPITLSGKFSVKLAGDRFTCSTWEGPKWNGKEWVGEQIKKS